MAEKDPTTFWIKFFTDAGIPTSEAANHAVTFVQNRITQDMMLDLTKEYLSDMGITMMGDVIAILRHAKQVVSQTSKSKLLKGVMINPITGSPMRSTVASRTVAHYLRSGDGIDSPKPISIELASRLGTKDSPSRSNSPNVVRLNKVVRTKDDVPVPKSRRVFPEHEGKYKVKMPSGNTARSRRLLAKQRAAAELGITASTDSGSVFNRLGAGGSEGTAVTVTGLSKVIINKPTASSQDSSVFSRLGGTVKRAATSTVPDDSDVTMSDVTSDITSDEDEQLEYHGILRRRKVNDEQRRKSKRIRTVNIIEPTAKPALADEPCASTAGIFSPFSQAQAKKPVTQRLGKPVVAEAQTTTAVTTPNVKRAVAKKDLQSRLGPATKNTKFAAASQANVFSRLGKQL